ncbi:MAG TPA: FAD-dependent oxidoreductase [Thermoanaerobaculia bacterium]|jgi:thioredoxin reductase/NAD-dependent dihydropyrimidine dehydrogenase PreA subunit
MIPESLLWWSAALAVSAGVIVPYARQFRRRVHHDRERKLEASQLGIDKPSAQFPFIDPAHCIGCGACVRACPEGDVLGIVGGTAVVVNGLRCVGHARCEEACPVGAIEVGLGDLKSREDVPLLGQRYETSVPGIYVVGELGGLSLVRNAVKQGREVIGYIDELPVACDPLPETLVTGNGQPATANAFDVLIIGAGPAGLSAALEAAARGLSYVVLEKEESLGGSLLHYPRRKMVLLQPVDVCDSVTLDRDEYSKEHLLELFESLLAAKKINIEFGVRVESIEREEGLFRVGTRRTRNIVLALGRRGTPRKLGVPGEELPKVMYRLIDAESYRNQRLLVVGGGDSAVEAAIGLALQPGNTVTLSYRRDKLVRIKKKNEDALAKMLASGRVIPLFNSQPVEITPGAVRLKVGDELRELPNDYVFVFAGGVPPFELLKKAGVRMGGLSGATGS